MQTLSSPIWVPRDAVFEKIETFPDGQPLMRLVIHTFSDGKFAWNVYIYKQEGNLEWDMSKPTGRVIWDGKHKIAVSHITRSTTSFILTQPSWGIKQLTLQINQRDKVRELTDTAPDRSLLTPPAEYVERAPSEHHATLVKRTGVTESECIANQQISLDGTYFGSQVEKSFVYERVLPTPGSPRLQYDIYDFGMVVRTDFRGTEVKTIVYDPRNMVRRVFDDVSKSVSTYPWLPSDTDAWRSAITVPDELKSKDKHVDDNVGYKWQSIEGYTERSPSETYLAFGQLTGQAPDERWLAAARIMDVEYAAGQEALNKRAAACSVKPAAQN